MSKDFGLSNVYLKAGLALVVLSVAVLVAAPFVPSVTGSVSGRLAGFCLVSGLVLYVIGRIAKARRSQAQA